MLRETSLEAFEKITQDGLLSRKRLFIYGELFENGPCTANELYSFGNYNDTTQANLHARLGELRESGVVSERGVKKCAITGRKAIVWDVTKELPKPLPKRLTNTAKIARYQRALIFLRSHVDGNQVVIDKVNKILRGD